MSAAPIKITLDIKVTKWCINQVRILLAFKPQKRANSTPDTWTEEGGRGHPHTTPISN